MSPERRIFFSGDSGYAPHFAEIGRPIDLDGRAQAFTAWWEDLARRNDAVAVQR